EQLSIRETLRVEFDLHHLGVASVPRADLLVGGVRRRAACVTGNDVRYAFHFVKDGLKAPETTTAKRSDLAAGAVHRWVIRLSHRVLLLNCKLTFTAIIVNWLDNCKQFVHGRPNRAWG